MIEYVKKDITTVETGLIAHGVNCQLVMGAGIARALFNKWSRVKTEYLELGWKGGKHLGKVYLVQVEKNLIVANCYTQEFYGRAERRYADPEAVKECLRKVFNTAYEYSVDVHIPKIGCGLAGLDWSSDVLPSLKSVVEEYNGMVNVTVYELP